MGNFSIDPQTVLQDALEKGYHRVRFQQGKPILDRELNLLEDLIGPQRLALHHLGNGVPEGSDGFRVSDLNVAANDFTIHAGRCLVSGYEVVLTENTTYQSQPHTENVSNLPAGRSNVYLRVFSSEVTGVQDSELQNSGDVGFETAVREKTEWEVLVTTSVISAPDHFLLAVIDTNAGSVEDRRRTGLTLSALRDEIATARGNQTTLSDRLDTSLKADGELKNHAVTGQHIRNNSVAIAHLSSTLVLDAEVSVPAASSGHVGRLRVVIETRDTHAFYLKSVRFVGPRPSVRLIPLLRAFDWKHGSALVHPEQAPPDFWLHQHQLLIENPNTFAISVACKVYRLSET